MSSWSSRSSSNPAAGSWPWRTRHWYADGGGLSVGDGRSSLEQDTGDLASVVDAISRPRSAFEQYQALAAALEMLSRLDSSERERLASAIRQQLESGEWITPSTGRYSLAQRILSVIDQEELL